MRFPTLEIVRKKSRGRNGRRAQAIKTRAFSVSLLGYVTADALWEGGSCDNLIRPVWIACFGTEQESRVFFANFRSGYKAKTSSARFQLPKKALYRWSTQEVPGGVISVGYLTELVELEPGVTMDDIVRFVLAPPSWWIDQQARELEEEFGEEAREVAHAALFAAYLDRRTPLPLIRDLRFHLQLYRSALETDWVHEPSGYDTHRGVCFAEQFSSSGLDSPLACQVSQAELGEFLRQQTYQFHQENQHHGTSRIPTDRWLLPDADPATLQLRFDFALAGG